MIAMDSREVDNGRDRDADTDDKESVGTDPDTGRGRRYPSMLRLVASVASLLS